MEEKDPKSKTEKLYVPPKILASYGKEQLEEILKRSGLHASGGGCSSGGSILINENRPDGMPPP